MIRKILHRLARNGKGDVMVRICPAPDFLENGKVIFLNTILRINNLKPKKFQGMKKIQELSVLLNRPITFYGRSLKGNCCGIVPTEVRVTPKTTQEELAYFVQKMNEDERFQCWMASSGNPNLPHERIPTFYV